jgi:hypothetical protein
MLVVLLGLTFTVLPYLTSGLLDALMSTSSYQRKRYMRVWLCFCRVTALGLCFSSGSTQQ